MQAWRLEDRIRGLMRHTLLANERELLGIISELRRQQPGYSLAPVGHALNRAFPRSSWRKNIGNLWLTINGGDGPRRTNLKRMTNLKLSHRNPCLAGNCRTGRKGSSWHSRRTGIAEWGAPLDDNCNGCYYLQESGRFKQQLWFSKIPGKLGSGRLCR
jgi:hypothetical protein